MRAAKKLIESRVEEMHTTEEHLPFRYVCMSTGQYFESYGGPAQYSPYTGSSYFELLPMNHQTEATRRVIEMSGDAMKASGVPSNQKDQMKQTPLQSNPAGDKKPGDWKNTPWKSNPASDSGMPGSDSANSKGYTD